MSADQPTPNPFPDPAPAGSADDAWAKAIRRKKRPPALDPVAMINEPVQETSSTSNGRTPLTDPRSVGSSVVFHAMLLVVASIAALSVSIPSEKAASPTAMRGDLGPVDNRAPSDSGGSPGDLGGSDLVRIAADGQSAESQALRDPSADALLSEMLPATSSPDLSQRALPGPMTTGIGLLPGPGLGGGGGSGGGSGGGNGRGIGPGTGFFGVQEHAGSFAYVIDCSGSMSLHRALEFAKNELLASLSQLPPDAKFGVVFYNLSISEFTDAKGQQGLMDATASNKARIRTFLSTVVPNGGTDHMIALRAALAMRPEVIFFLTDADQMSDRNVADVVAEVGPTRIQAIEFGIGPSLSDSGPLRKLARRTGGSYRYIDVMRFGQ
ncbi:MAG TPA: hypothetical protein VGZ22_03650 [Isosphaeraceae bacterium]|jgi:hypothetical protein|nr:hypothetical protein [Isosphaeraceae bacterium]